MRTGYVTIWESFSFETWKKGQGKKAVEQRSKRTMFFSLVVSIPPGQIRKQEISK